MNRAAPGVDTEPLGGAHQRLDLATAMAAYTSGTAYVNHRDHDTGCIAAGLSREPRRARPRPVLAARRRDPPRDGRLDLGRGRAGLHASRLTPTKERTCPCPASQQHVAIRAPVSRSPSPAASAPRSHSPRCTAPEPDAAPPAEYELTAETGAPSGDIDSFSWVSYAEPYSLDYAYAFDYSDNQVLANVCESLLRLNPDYTLAPGLAESYAHPTPTTWVYTIRDGVRFHDGTTLTAADVVASLSRHIDPAVGSSWYSVYQNVVSIEQTGEREVTVTESVPSSQFNLAMGGSAGVVESAATLEEIGADYGNSSGGVNCTGPFRFEEWKPGRASRSPAPTTTGTRRSARSRARCGSSS